MAREQDLTAAKRQKLLELTAGFRGIVVFLFLVSGIINILALTGSLYMMQIYDRALTSGSIPTLFCTLGARRSDFTSSRAAST